MSKRKAIYPGSFDPVTNGHLDLIQRAVKLFDEVIVLVAANAEKNSFFTIEERITFLRRALRGTKNVKVEAFQGLTVRFAEKYGANALIRGIRATSDFDYEFQMALTNRRLAKKVDTVFLMPSESNFYLSSRLIKEIAELNGDVSKYVPKFLVGELRKKFKSRSLT